MRKQRATTKKVGLTLKGDRNSPGWSEEFGESLGGNLGVLSWEATFEAWCEAATSEAMKILIDSA